MTSFERFGSRNYDMQDGFERTVWGEQEYVDGKGSVIKVNGTDTEDEEATVLNIGGVSFNLPKGSNTEVMLLSGGSDTNLKFAILTIPFDKQRKWKENTGGVQHPTDPDVALEFNGKRAHLTKGDFATGAGGVFEVVGDTVYIRGKLVVERTVTANEKVITPKGESGTESIPGFSA